MYSQVCRAGRGFTTGRWCQRASAEPPPAAQAPIGGEPSIAEPSQRPSDNGPVSEQALICTVCGYGARRVAPTKCPVCGSDGSGFRSLR